MTPHIPMTEEELEDRFRSDFSQDEYDEGRTTRITEINVNIPWKQVVAEIQAAVVNTRQGLSRSKNLLQLVTLVCDCN